MKNPSKLKKLLLFLHLIKTGKELVKDLEPQIKQITMKKILSLITEWLKNEAELIAKEALEAVNVYLNELISNLPNIISGKATIPGLPNNLPAWAQELVKELLILADIDPTLIEGAVKKLQADFEVMITDLANKINSKPASVPADEQTESYKALAKNLADISEAAGNILKIAPGASTNITAIQTIAKNSAPLLDSLVTEAKAKK